MKKYRIGIDIGGTFTDGCVIREDGKVWEAKAPSTPPFFFDGILDCLQELGKQIDLDRRNLMQQCDFFFNATTIVTNTIVQLNGAKVGLITTKGFRDTLRIARIQKPQGETDILKYVAMPELVKFEDIKEIDERVMYGGKVVVPLNREQVREKARELVEGGVEAIAVVLLWSFEEPAHEIEVKKIIQELYPDLYVCVSCEVHPVIREYERTVTTVMNAYVAPVVSRYVGGLRSRLAEFGYTNDNYFMHCGGGYLTADEVVQTPIRLMHSGPVGGVIGARELGRELGFPNVITADVGGTTFDTSIITGGELQHESRAKLGRFSTGLTFVLVSSIGAGGGSILWVDSRGALRLGPQSTGAVPGPACYGAGGTEPTLTDCCLLLGMLHPDRFLDGRIRLNTSAASAAVRKVASLINWSVEETAAAAWRLLVTGAGEAIRDVSVRRGHEPSDYVMASFGGASSLFAADICREMGIRKAIVPPLASVFSASGLLVSDYKREYIRSFNYRAGQDIGPMNEIFADLKSKVSVDLKKVGFDRNQVKVAIEADMRYVGQFHELTIPMDDKVLTAGDFSDVIHRRFVQTYERAYGAGTSWTGGEPEIINLRVTGLGIMPKVSSMLIPAENKDISACMREKREVFLPTEKKSETIPVFMYDRMAPGMEIDGPALIEHQLTTIFLPPQSAGRMDQKMAFHLDL